MKDTPIWHEANLVIATSASTFKFAPSCESNKPTKEDDWNRCYLRPWIWMIPLSNQNRQTFLYPRCEIVIDRICLVKPLMAGTSVVNVTPCCQEKRDAIFIRHQLYSRLKYNVVSYVDICFSFENHEAVVEKLISEQRQRWSGIFSDSLLHGSSCSLHSKELKNGWKRAVLAVAE